MAVLVTIALAAVGLLIITFSLYAAAVWRLKKRRELMQRSHSSRPGSLSIGFLHPNSLSGGGGERVLWCALLAMQQRFPQSKLVVYSAWSDAAVPLGQAVDAARVKVLAQFGLNLEDVSFLPVDLPCAGLVDPTRYPRLTLLLQAIGAVRLGAYAYQAQPVDIFIDTANLTFALAAPKLLGARTVSYVHYPTISTDMLRVVRERKVQFNNNTGIAQSVGLSLLKLWYYRTFALFYAVAALSCDTAMANSSWTAGHLRALWWRGDEIITVFPPCPTLVDGDKVAKGGGEHAREEGLILSVGQFRPEKDHALQLDIMEVVQGRGGAATRAHLAMVGGARDARDRARAEALRAQARQRGLAVDVRVNVGREELGALLRAARVGLHTMRDEHFGISVVELQAAGLVVVAHRSGGVAADIVKDGESGMLAGGGVEEYADRVEEALVGKEAMQAEGVRSARRFSEAAFRDAFAKVVAALEAEIL